MFFETDRSERYVLDHFTASSFLRHHYEECHQASKLPQISGAQYAVSKSLDVELCRRRRYTAVCCFRVVNTPEAGF